MVSAAARPIRVDDQNLYIEPISACNLRCRMCYTNVINGPGRQVIDARRILDFVHRFMEVSPRPVTVYWCGTGEVFLHKDFPSMVDQLQEAYGEGLEQSIQTNGTVNRLKELRSVPWLHFRVSIDGSREFHDWHRGEGTYERTLKFCREAVERGCRSLTVRTLLTRANIAHLETFHDELRTRIGPGVELRLLVPFNNQDLSRVRAATPGITRKEIDDSLTLSQQEAEHFLRQRYGGRYSVEEQNDAVGNSLSVTPYGVFTCCNGIIEVGKLETDVRHMKERMHASEEKCRSCSLFPCE